MNATIEQCTFRPVLSGSTLVLLAELLTIFRQLNESTVECINNNKGLRFFYTENLDKMLCEAMREILRVPLQDPRFRKQFNQHFTEHPMRMLRQEGVEWLSEVLLWEK